MISTEEALNSILKNTPESPLVALELDSSFQEVLREDLVADRDFPPFDRVAMDGIALDSRAWERGIREFPIEGIQASGAEPLLLSADTHCLEIMTGAMLSQGCDAVVPYERIDIKDNRATIHSDVKVVPWMNIHRQGVDQKKGDVILQSGQLILSPHVAVAASIGKVNLKVSVKPRIHIISTGDELVGVSELPKEYQIRVSNSHSLAAAVQSLDLGIVEHKKVKDDEALLSREIKKSLTQCEILILTGGVSKGKFDYIPELLEQQGVEKKFHRVKQKPGKPLWFGVKEPLNNTSKILVFGLPGNPVASLICFYRYVVPSIKKSLGLIDEFSFKIKLQKSVHPKKELTHYLPVKLEVQKETKQLEARLVQSNGSGDLISLALSDGFIELKPEQFTEEEQKGTFFSWGKM